MTAQKTFEYVPPTPEEEDAADQKHQAQMADLEPQADSCPQHEDAAPAPDPAPKPAAHPPLAVIEIKKESAMAVFTAENGLDPYLKELEKRARASVAGCDVTTIAGQDAIRSAAYSLARSKAPLKDMADELNEQAKAVVKKVNAERDRGIAYIDELQAELRRPLTEYEEREKIRIKAHKDRLSDLEGLAVLAPGLPVTSEEIQARIDRLAADFKDVNWQEFTESAKAATEKTQNTLADMLVKTKKAEDDAAELVRLRKEQADREQKERDDKIARDAAENARIEAERVAEENRKKAAAEAAFELAWTEAHAEKADRDAKAEQARILREKEESEQRARDEQARLQREKDQAEADRKRGHESNLRALQSLGTFDGADEPPPVAVIEDREKRVEKAATLDWQEYADQAKKAIDEVTKELAATKAERVRLDDESRKAEEARQEKARKDAADAAAERERQFQRDKAAQEERDRLAREADQKHRDTINAAALSVLQAIMDELFEQGKSTPEIAKTIIVWIAEGKVPNITIKY